jgi:sugar lactone lactonase YvrE
VPTACCVRVRAGGEVLARVELDRGGFACMLGGPDRSTLYVVAAEWRGIAAAGSGASGVVVAVGAPAPGAGWP